MLLISHSFCLLAHQEAVSTRRHSPASQQPETEERRPLRGGRRRHQPQGWRRRRSWKGQLGWRRRWKRYQRVWNHPREAKDHRQWQQQDDKCFPDKTSTSASTATTPATGRGGWWWWCVEYGVDFRFLRVKANGLFYGREMRDCFKKWVMLLDS